MFAPRYFAIRFFAARYFAPGGDGAVAVVNNRAGYPQLLIIPGRLMQR